LAFIGFYLRHLRMAPFPPPIKAAQTRKRKAAARKAWRTRREKGEG